MGMVCPHCGKDKGATKNGTAMIEESMTVSYRFTGRGIVEYDRDYSNSETVDETLDDEYTCNACDQTFDEPIDGESVDWRECQSCSEAIRDHEGEGYEDGNGDWWCNNHIENGKDYDRRYYPERLKNVGIIIPDVSDPKEEEEAVTTIKDDDRIFDIKIILPDGTEKEWDRKTFTVNDVRETIGGSYSYCRLKAPAGERRSLFFLTKPVDDAERNPLATQYLKIFKDGDVIGAIPRDGIKGAAIISRASLTVV